MAGNSWAKAMKIFYRIAYRGTNNQIFRSNNFYDLASASRIATDLNRNFKQQGEYFTEGANIAELPLAQLKRLYQFKLVVYQDLVRYAGAAVAQRVLKRNLAMHRSR